MPEPTIETLDFEPGLIYGKLIEAAKLMEGVEKGGENKSQGFKFRGIEQLTKACAPIFKEVGIVMVPVMRAMPEVAQPPKGYRSVIEAGYTFYAEDGSSVTCVTIGEGVDTYDKATNKAMSAAFKYALLQTLCIGDPDDDGDNHVPPAEERQAPPSPPAPPVKNEVGPKEWGEWNATRDRLLADDDLKTEFAAWVAEQSFKVDRAMSLADFEVLVAKAEDMLNAKKAAETQSVS